MVEIEKTELMRGSTMQLILRKVKPHKEGEICYLGRDDTRDVEPG